MGGGGRQNQHTRGIWTSQQKFRKRGVIAARDNGVGQFGNRWIAAFPPALLSFQGRRSRGSPSAKASIQYLSEDSTPDLTHTTLSFCGQAASLLSFSLSSISVAKGGRVSLDFFPSCGFVNSTAFCNNPFFLSSPSPDRRLPTLYATYLQWTRRHITYAFASRGIIAFQPQTLSGLKGASICCADTAEPG